MIKLKKILLFGGISAIVLGGMVSNCAPASFRLAAPVLCPSDTQESVVRYYSYTSGKTSHAKSDLFCIDADGNGVPVDSLPLYLTLMALALPLTLGAAFFVTRGES